MDSRPPRTAGNTKDERPNWIKKLLKDSKPLIASTVGDRKLKNDDIIGLDVSLGWTFHHWDG